ncbi:DnaJ domain-containing protein [Pseudomonas sp. 1D4]|uniref:DnaJ domain-containing protein n=1 Tax=Pseudomonas sp. 1D4 TaxID=1843691 RepID=UPI0009F4A4CF|nr:DnaJ domain-containing protein [Pseudomonas sp. 1D4]
MDVKLRTHYDNLHITENASQEVVKAAYKALAQKWHPDKHPSNRVKAERYFKIITRAFEVLSDPKARAEYDAWLKKQRDNLDGDPKEKSAADNHSPEPPVQNHGKQDSHPAHPWRRFFARFIDTLIFTSASILFISFINHLFGQNINDYLGDSPLKWFVIGAVGTIIIEALCVHKASTTPGKFIFGIYITDEHGNKPGANESLERSLLANLIGQGACIPFAGIITYPISYFLLKRNGLTPWDSKAGTRVTCRPLSSGRWALCITASVVAVLMNGVLFNLRESAWMDHLVSKREASLAERDRPPVSSGTTYGSPQQDDEYDVDVAIQLGIAYRNFPFLDHTKPYANQAAIAEVIQVRNSLIAKGYSVADAIRIAVNQVGPKYAK